MQRTVGNRPRHTEGSDDLPDRLIRYRARTGASRTAVATAVNITQQALGFIERRICSPRDTTRLRLEEFLRRRGFGRKGKRNGHR